MANPQKPAKAVKALIRKQTTPTVYDVRKVLKNVENKKNN